MCVCVLLCVRALKMCVSVSRTGDTGHYNTHARDTAALETISIIVAVVFFYFQFFWLANYYCVDASVSWISGIKTQK